MASFGQEVSEQLEQVLLNDRHSEQSIAVLERCLALQVEKKIYHNEANFALLKLYQFYPHLQNVDNLELIFLKALLHLEDFLPSLYLLPYTLQCSEPFTTLQKLAGYLDTAKFGEFWELASSSGLAQKVSGFDDAAREQIGSFLALAYQVVPVKVAKTALRFDGDEPGFSTFLKKHDWALDDFEMVNVPLNGENKPRAKKFEENIELSQVAPLLTVLGKA